MGVVRSKCTRLIFIVTILVLLLCYNFHILVNQYNVITDTDKPSMLFIINNDLSLHIDLCEDKKNSNLLLAQICPVNHVVVVNHDMNGRLGNYMWEYAALWAYTRYHNYNPYGTPCMLETLEVIFEGISIPALSRLSGCEMKQAPSSNETGVRDQRTVNGGNVTVLPQTNVEDYLLLARLVVKYVDNIRQEFAFKLPLVERSKHILEDIANMRGGEVTYISVHVRRTDYKSYLHHRHNLTLAPISFYYNAMNYFRTRYLNAVFLVVSDDIPWCTTNLALDDVIVVSEYRSSGEEDLALMAHCDHSIVDYGTFGDWGAILAGGEVVVYNLTAGITQGLAALMPKWRVIN